MSDETPAYSQTYIQAWTILSLLVSTIVFICFVFGTTFLRTGHWIWDLLRYLASPII
jgi:ABC-type multidrug transport system permease subunit